MSSVENSIYTESSGSESDNSLSSQSTDSDYIPSQTPETESYTSYESSDHQHRQNRNILHIVV